MPKNKFWINSDDYSTDNYSTDDYSIDEYSSEKSKDLQKCNDYYLYCDINSLTINKLIKFIKNLENWWKVFLDESKDIIKYVEPKPINIYINSINGDIIAAFSAIDVIKNSIIPIHTYLEGISNPASSLLCFISHKRFISKNALMIIYEKNKLIEYKYKKNILLIKNLYLEKSIDIYKYSNKSLTSDECIKYNFVDEIIS